jgi:hypothetical protein
MGHPRSGCPIVVRAGPDPPSQIAFDIRRVLFMSPRPHLPADVAFTVRQHCGFGCVICGAPIYEYDHMLGIQETGDDPDFITLLCSKHHRDKTARRLPLATVLAANEDPYNRRNALTTGTDLYFSDNRVITFDLGAFRMTTAPNSLQNVGIVIDGAVALGASITDGHLRLDMNFRDLNNKLLLLVTDGVLRFANRNWDITYIGTKIQIRRGNRDVVLDMDVDAETSTITVNTADFALNHIRVHIGSRAKGRGLWLPNGQNIMTGFSYVGGTVIVGAGRQGFGGFAFSDWPRAYGAPPAPVGAFRADKMVRPWGMSGVRRSILSAGATGSPSPYTLAPQWEEPPRSCVSAAAAPPTDDGRAQASPAAAAAAAPAEDAR